MRLSPLHQWPSDASEAVRLQKELAAKVELRPLARKPRLIAGADISYNRYSPIFHAGFVVIDAVTLKVVARTGAVVECHFPYVPGLLTFREGPALLEAWRKLEVEPDVVIFDGQGIAHPRGMGIAAHMGLWIGKPSLGCGKSILCGSFENLGLSAGSTAPLLFKGKTVGYAVRTRDRVQPVYVSPGHLIDFGDAVAVALSTCAGYRIPEPTRQAHLFVNELRRAYVDKAA